MSNGRTPGYVNWSTNEPNNGVGQGGVRYREQDCVTIGIYDAEKWDDDICSTRWQFACEMEL